MSHPRRTRGRRLLAAVGAAAVMAGCVVEDPQPGDLVGSRAVAPYDGQGVGDVRTVAYGPDRAQQLDIHLPSGWSPRDTRPVLVHFHGGAWVGGDRAMVPGVIRAQLQRGWVVVSADYRLAPSATWPAQSHDVDRAVRWVRAAASSLGIDTERMYLSGHSAGAHLALLHGVAIDRFVDPGLPAALASVPASVAGVVALSAPSDLAALNFDVWGYTSDAVLAWLFACAGTCDPAVLAEASPVTFVSTDDPPVYIAHGADDAVVDVSHATGLYAAFEAVGLATQTMLDVVDSVQVGGRSRSLPDTSRGHDADTGVNLAALERFLDRTE